jgi:hypothetical protein
MKVPEHFKTRTGGNFCEDTPNLVVYSDATILRVERDDGGDFSVKLVIYDSSGRRTALLEDTAFVDGNADDFNVTETEHTFSVREKATGRVICKLQRCSATRSMDLDAFILTHAPDGFFIHANPVQTNMNTKSTGELYVGLPAALVMK